MEGIVVQGYEVGIKKMGVSASIPSNDYARLMYYLNCILYCIPNFDLPKKYTNYGSYYHLTGDEEKEVVLLALLLSPDLLLNKIIFAVPNGSPALSGRTNEFYEISETHKLGAVATNLEDFVVIKGERVRVNKIMLMCENWLKDYYLNPIVRITQQLESGNATAAGVSYYSDNNYGQGSNNSGSRAQPRSNDNYRQGSNNNGLRVQNRSDNNGRLGSINNAPKVQNNSDVYYRQDSNDNRPSKCVIFLALLFICGFCGFIYLIFTR